MSPSPKSRARRAFCGLSPGALLVAALAAVVAAGSWAFDITNTAFVDYTNEAGVAQPPATSSAVFSVENVIALMKSADRGAAKPGETVYFTLVVTNTSVVTAFNIVVVDTLPGLLAYVPASGSPALATALKGPPELLAWNVGTLDIGKSAFLSYAVVAGDPGPASFGAANEAMALYKDFSGTPAPPVRATVTVTVNPKGGQPARDVQVVVSVYDSTGRLVRVVGSLMAAQAAGGISLADGSGIAKPGDGEAIVFRLSDGTVLRWDGFDSGGALAPNGAYTVRVVSRIPGGQEKTAWATFTLFRPYKSLIVTALLVPNPASSVAWVAFSLASTTATVRVKVYTVAGELLLEGELPGTARAFRWDLRNRQGSRVSDGLYVIVLEAEDRAMGRRDRRILKLAVGGGE